MNCVAARRNTLQVAIALQSPGHPPHATQFGSGFADRDLPSARDRRHHAPRDEHIAVGEILISGLKCGK
jgi:hypothetical protein